MTQLEILDYAFEGVQNKLYEERKTLHTYKTALRKYGGILPKEKLTKLETLITEQEKTVNQIHEKYRDISDMIIELERGTLL